MKLYIFSPLSNILCRPVFLIGTSWENFRDEGRGWENNFLVSDCENEEGVTIAVTP